MILMLRLHYTGRILEVDRLAFTELQERILKAAASAGGARLTFPELANRAFTSVERIYANLVDPEFRMLLVETHRTALLADVPEIMNAFVQEAKSGSFKHGKLILEIAEVYQEKKTITNNIKVTEAPPFASPDERRSFAAATLAQLGQGVALLDSGDSNDTE